MSAKPLPPSQKRLRDARAKGDVPRSEMLAAWIVLGLGIEVVFAGARAACDAWFDLLHFAFAQLDGPRPLSALPHLFAFSTLTALGGLGLRLIAGAVGAVLVAAFVAAVLGAWACGGVRFAPKVLAPSVERLNPVHHVRQIFSARNLATTVTALAAALIVGGVGAVILIEHLPLFAALARSPALEANAHVGLNTLHTLLRTCLTALIVPTVVGTIVTKRLHLRKLRMSHREAKDEFKQMTGDPLVRARQRAALFEAASLPRAANRPGGCALVTNPEHLAVMLHYEGAPDTVPAVIAIAADEHAWHMTADAITRQIPVFRFAKLARRLHAHGATQASIPPDCYRAVAIVYRLVEEMQSLGAQPAEPIDIDDALFED